jgi:phage portal protein BeeE
MQNSQTQIISQKTQDLIDKLLLGKFSLAEIAKVTGVSDQCLQDYVNAKYDLASR